MDTQTRSHYAEAGRKKLEEFRRKKAEEKAAAAKAEAGQIATPLPPRLPPSTTAGVAEKDETTALADVVPLADPQAMATEVDTTFVVAKEAPSWPSPTPGVASAAAAAAAAAMIKAPWDNGLHSNASDSLDPLQASYSVPQLYHQVTHEQQQQHQEVEKAAVVPATHPAAAAAAAAAASYETSSFSSYTNFLADPPLPPSLNQEHSQHQPLFEASATTGSVHPQNGANDDVSNDMTTARAAADKVHHHHSSFLSSMQLDINSTSFLNNNNPISNNGSANANEKKALTFGKIPPDTTTSPPQSRLAPSTSSPTPSSPNIGSTTTVTTTANTTTTAAGDGDTVCKGGNSINIDNSTEGDNNRVTRPIKDFKELQQHIGELTEEKFTLQLCLEQQTALADRLAVENEELTMQVNTSGRALEESRYELDVRRREVAVARADIAAAMAERDAYEMGARESSERAKTLAIEVVALEEKLLKMKSEQLKMMSEKEKAGRNKNNGQKSGIGAIDDDNDDDNSISMSTSSAAAAAVMAAERRAEVVSEQLHAANRQIEEMKREREGAQQQLAKVNAEVEALTRVAREGKERKEAAAAEEQGNHSMQIEQQQQLEIRAQREKADAATTREAEERSRSAGREHHPTQESAHRKECLKPPPSALVAGEAMMEAENLSKSREKDLKENEEDEEEEEDAVPAEIRALLPPAVWTPGAQGLDPSVNDLVERIYEVVGMLESETSETAAALAAQRQTNVALQARLDALLASQELELQKSGSQPYPKQKLSQKAKKFSLLYFCAGAARKLKSYTDTNGNPVPFKWTPGYVSATLAEAWADVLRTKAQAKYNKSDVPQVLPQPVPGPSKSKNFAYTSIRLSSDATGMPDVPTGGDLLPITQGPPVQQQVANPFATTTSVPVSGARPVAPTPNPFATTTAGTGNPHSPEQSDELQAKLQQLQKQLEELEALKAELDASKTSTEGGGGTTAGSRRKLLDSGLPGWDPGMLLEKKLDILATETALLQSKLSEDAWKMQGKIGDNLANVGMMGTATMDAIGARQDNIRNALDRYRNKLERKAGDFQDLLGEVMDARAERRFSRLGLGHF